MRHLVRLSILASLILLVSAAELRAQKQYNNWYFGNVGLDFNVDPPTPLLDSKLTTDEGSASMSDPLTGELMFYTDGVTVYDRDHNPMPNGNGLEGHESSTQSVIIVKDPAKASAYYLITSDQSGYAGFPRGVKYSSVDMSRNGGKGDVVFKNVPLLGKATEKLAALQDCNGHSWIIARELESHKFYAWRLDENGISSMPIVSTVGIKTKPNDPEDGIGYMDISPNGEMIASVTHHFAELFRFNKKTGVVSDALHLASDTPPGPGQVNGSLFYGIAFSPDSKKLYTGRSDTLFQYDVSSYDINAIMNSLITLDVEGQVCAIRRGPDNNMYLRVGINVCRIVDPNSTSFKYESSIMLPGNPSIGLPTDPVVLNSGDCPPPIAKFSSVDSICVGGCIDFTDHSENEPHTWEWTFNGGTPATSTSNKPPKICYDTPGKYDVRLIVVNDYGRDTTTKTISIGDCPVPVVTLRDTTICAGRCITFRDTSSLSTEWEWSFVGGTPATDASRNTQAICFAAVGSYQVQLIARNQSGADTAYCTVTVVDCPPPVAALDFDSTICAGDMIDFTDKSTGSATAWEWQFQTGSPSSSTAQHPKQVRFDVAGKHSVRLISKNDNGSDTVFATITVGECFPPVAQLRDTMICIGECIDFVDRSLNGPTSWRWTFSGVTPTQFTVRDPGLVCYNAAGRYPVELICANEYGADTATAFVTVLAQEGSVAISSIELEDTLITCTSADTAFSLYSGCESLTFNVAQTTATNVTLAPISGTLKANDSVRIAVHIDPAPAGMHRFNVSLTLGTVQHMVPVTYHVKPSGALTTSLTNIDFGTSYICEERDTAITIDNQGCDTVYIARAEIDPKFGVEHDFPIIILPGRSATIPIVTIADTTDQQTDQNGTLRFVTWSGHTLPDIKLSRKLRYPARLVLKSMGDKRGSAGTIVKIQIAIEGDVSDSIKALHFDLLHNNDLLSFVNLASTSLTLTSTTGYAEQRQRFKLEPVTGPGVIGELTLRTFMAAAESTTFSFENIALDVNGPLAPECLVALTDSAARFDYIYTCGDGFMHRHLSDLQLIKHITPNPAIDELHLELNAADANVSIIDMLGVEVLIAKSGRIDVSKLPSGTYYVRVSAAGDIQTRRVLIQR